MKHNRKHRQNLGVCGLMTVLVIFRNRLRWMLVSVAFAFLLTACAPSPQMNVLGYWVSERLGTLEPVEASVPTGSLLGRVMDGDTPVVGASVVVAERTGRPHSAKTDETGRYRIDDVPVGQYVPSAIAPGYDEAVAVDSVGIPRLATVEAGTESEAPTILLTRRVPVALPEPLADAVHLTLTGTYTATAPFPEGAAAQVQTFRFERDGVVNDTLRLYLPLDGTKDTEEASAALLLLPWRGRRMGAGQRGLCLRRLWRRGPFAYRGVGRRCRCPCHGCTDSAATGAERRAGPFVCRWPGGGDWRQLQQRHPQSTVARCRTKTISAPG